MSALIQWVQQSMGMHHPGRQKMNDLYHTSNSVREIGKFSLLKKLLHTQALECIQFRK